MNAFLASLVGAFIGIILANVVVAFYKAWRELRGKS